MTIVLDGSEIEILGLEPGKPRQVVALSNDRKYATRTVVTTDDPQPRTIRLEPVASVSGRIVDVNGKPVKAVLVQAEGYAGVTLQGRSDADGRFRIDALLPGQRCSAEVRGGSKETEMLGKAFENIVLRAGEVRDLGEIRVKPSVEGK
jgi:hypothetical protein